VIGGKKPRRKPNRKFDRCGKIGKIEKSSEEGTPLGDGRENPEPSEGVKRSRKLNRKKGY
jgi:hypothetical protein